VLGLTFGGAHKAYPVSVVNDTVGGKDVVIVASRITSDVRVYERNGKTFDPAPNAAGNGRPSTLVDNEGETWDVTESRLEAADGSATLARLPSNIFFWFAWFAFHPKTELYEGG